MSQALELLRKSAGIINPRLRKRAELSSYLRFLAVLSLVATVGSFTVVFAEFGYSQKFYHWIAFCLLMGFTNVLLYKSRAL